MFVRAIVLLNQSAAGTGIIVPVGDLEDATVEVSGIGGGDTIQLIGSNRPLKGNVAPTSGQMQDVGSAISADGVYAVSPSMPLWLAATKVGANGTVTVRVSGKSTN